MKKSVFFLTLIISVVLVVSCGSMSGGKVTDDTFRAIYDKYKDGDGLILDGAQRYIVKDGDTLVDIARSFYGDGFYYPVILLASRDVVLDMDEIQPGMELTIPNLQRNLSERKATIKGVMLDCAVAEDTRNRSGTADGLRDLANTL